MPVLNVAKLISRSCNLILHPQVAVLLKQMSDLPFLTRFCDKIFVSCPVQFAAGRSELSKLSLDAAPLLLHVGRRTHDEDSKQFYFAFETRLRIG